MNAVRHVRAAVILVAITALVYPAIGWARDYPAFGPLTIRNQNPVYLETLGLTPTRAAVLSRGSAEVRIDWAYSNVFERGGDGVHMLDLDMEVSRIGLNVHYGLMHDLEARIEIPFYTLWHGFLDGFIQEFHKTFGLPNGGRNLVPDNRYHYAFSSNGRAIYEVSPQPFMIGDVTLGIKHRVVEETSRVPGVAWFADLKLPTGPNGSGTGNGSLDFGIGMAIEKSWKRLHGYLNAEYIVTAINNPLADFMRDEMLLFAAAVEVTLLDTWSIIAQLDGATPLLTGTGIDSWNGVPMDLIIGFRGCEPGLIAGHDLIWQAGFSEDVLSKGPSVDFTAFLSMGVRLHRHPRH